MRIDGEIHGGWELLHGYMQGAQEPVLCGRSDYGDLPGVGGYVGKATKCFRHTKDKLERLLLRCEEKRSKHKELYKSPVAN